MPVSEIYKTAEEAELAFYGAIECSDITALDNVLSLEKNVVWIHPGSVRIEGRNAVLKNFNDMFSDPPVMSFALADCLKNQYDDMAVHLVREEISVDGQIVSIMVSTNIYNYEKGGWRMVLHHSSYEPELDADEDFDDFEGFDEPEDYDELPEKPTVLH